MVHGKKACDKVMIELKNVAETQNAFASAMDAAAADTPKDDGAADAVKGEQPQWSRLAWN